MSTPSSFDSKVIVGDRRALRPGLELEEVDPAAPTREVGELLHDRRRRDRDCERREREVEPGRRSAGKPKRKPTIPATRPATGIVQMSRMSPVNWCPEKLERRFLVRHQDRSRIAADEHERAVAERDLAGDPGQQVEPQQRDEADPDVGELLCAEVAQQARQQQHRDDDERESAVADQVAARHTRLVTGLPKSPAGRTSRTTRMIRSATGRRRSAPTTST